MSEGDGGLGLIFGRRQRINIYLYLTGTCCKTVSNKISSVADHVAQLYDLPIALYIDISIKFGGFFCHNSYFEIHGRFRVEVRNVLDCCITGFLPKATVGF